MASSDDEGDQIVHDVSEYHFVDGKDEPVSFAELPVVWGNDASGGEVREIFLRGYTDNRKLGVYRQVKAWRFDISLPNPEISVLSLESQWIKLSQARKSYLEFIRTVIITVHFLHLLKNKADIPSNAFWDKLSKSSSFAEKPSEKDLVDHISLIREAVKRDDNLKTSNVLTKFLKNPMNMRILDKGVETSKKSSFIIDDSMVDGTNMNDENQEESDDEEDDSDLVCALCDNGGDLLSCEGRCLRSFHATTEAGCDSQCKSLGLSDEKVKRLPIFLCNNCKYKKHQCYACGKLGSSDESAGAEVFRCTIATCGHFYHPHCVAKLLSPRSDSKAEELRGKISTGEQFTCPIHECYLCKKGENKIESDLRFAVCRRCPKSYHRKCLPREIAFDGDEDEELVARAWEGLLPNGRILIYCLDHEIDEDLQTPLRNHIIFPDLDAKKKRVSSLSSGGRASFSSEGSSKRSRLVKASKAVEKLSSSEKQGDSSKKTEKRLSFQRSSGQCKAVGTSLKTSKNYSSAKSKKLLAPEGGPSLRDMSYSLISQNSDPGEPIHTGELEPPQSDEFGLRELDSSVDLDSDAIERIINIIEVTASEVTMEEIEKNCKMLGTSVDKLKAIVDRLHWYVQDGDTIVDFCCGSNDFSLILKQKLDEMGKICSYKNYDIHLPKNDFSFEKKDWMTVRPNELPSGSNLIMGINPPFGEANKFISKALQFKPKILILMVPRETDRLDGENMEFCYDLLWEDDELLTGKSFYLPGSIDVNGKQMEDTNVSAPPLYLWSRPDWTSTHKSIAKEKGHLMGMPEKVKLNENHNEMMEPTPPTECTGKSSMRVNYQRLLTKHEPPLEQRVLVIEKEKPNGTDNSQKHVSGYLMGIAEKVKLNETRNRMMKPTPPTECTGKSSMRVDDQCLLTEREPPLDQRASVTKKEKPSGTENSQKRGSGHLMRMPDKVMLNENRNEMIKPTPPTECTGKSSVRVNDQRLLTEHGPPLEQRVFVIEKQKPSGTDNSQKRGSGMGMPEKVKLNENRNEMMKPTPPTECTGKSSMRVNDQRLLTKHEPPLEQRVFVIEKEKPSGTDNSQKRGSGHLMAMPEKVKLNENHNGMMKPTPATECTGKSSMRVDDQRLLTEREPPLEQRASVTEKEKSSGTENSQKRGSQSSPILTREGEQGNTMVENPVKKSSAGKRPWRGRPSHPENRPVSGSNAQTQSRYGSGEEVDLRSNHKETEDFVERFNGNNNNKKKGYIRNEGPSKWARTSSPALGHNFRNPHEQFLEGGQGKKMENTPVQKSSPGKQSYSHHQNNSSLKRFKGSSNKKWRRGKPNNPEHTSVSGSDTQRQARYGSGKEVDQRTNRKVTEDSVWRFNGSKDDKNNGFIRNEGPSKWARTSSPTLGHSFRNPHEQFLEGGQGKKMENTPVQKSSPGKQSYSHHQNNSSSKRFKGSSNKKWRRGKPNNPEHTPVSGSDTQRQARYGSGEEFDRISNRKDTEDSVRRFNGNTDNKRKDYISIEGPNKWARTSSPAQLHPANQRMDHHLGDSSPVHAPPDAQLDPPVNSSHNHSPAMQRYAPRLDELNHTRANEPHIADRNCMNYPHRGHPISQSYSLGFAPSHHSSYLNGSCGWIDE